MAARFTLLVCRPGESLPVCDESPCAAANDNRPGRRIPTRRPACEMRGPVRVTERGNPIAAPCTSRTGPRNQPDASAIPLLLSAVWLLTVLFAMLAIYGQLVQPPPAGPVLVPRIQSAGG